MIAVSEVTGALYAVASANWPALVVAVAFAVARWVLNAPAEISR